MEPEPPTEPFLPVVKPLLLEALGRPFLAYVLGANEGEIEEWLVGPNDEFGTPQQTDALNHLHILLHIAQSHSGDPELRRMNVSGILGIYHESGQTTLANVVRSIATGEAVAPLEEDASLEQLLARMAYDMYPLCLLPQEVDSFLPGPTELHQHPLRRRFEKAVMSDNSLASLFPDHGESSGHYGSVYRSTGQGGHIQLATFASTLIDAGWRAARMAGERPSPEEHRQATLLQLGVVRKVVAGKAAKVPVRVAFTGVHLTFDRPLDLGWGVLRKADSRDSHLVPRDLKGRRLNSTGADGVAVEIEYSGDVVVDTTIEYRISLGTADLTNGWPAELRGRERINRLIENIQLGALLSHEYNPNEPITVLPAWYYIHDPLAHSYTVSWRDPGVGRSFMAKQVDESSAERWKEAAVTIERCRPKSIDVAIRRTLRASVERQDFVDVLVDAVIAWENLFGSRKGEPTLRVTGSVAWLLEDDATKRVALRSELTKLYSLRSDVVHGNPELSGQELAPKSQRALELAVASLRALFTERLDLLSECRDGDARSNRLLMGG